MYQRCPVSAKAGRCYLGEQGTGNREQGGASLPSGPWRGDLAYDVGLGGLPHAMGVLQPAVVVHADDLVVRRVLQDEGQWGGIGLRCDDRLFQDVGRVLSP